jgi:hypothetical protein
VQPDTAEISQARRARSVPKRLAAKHPDDRLNGHWLLLRQERNAAGDPNDCTLLTHPEDDCRSMSGLPKRPAQTLRRCPTGPARPWTATPLSSEFLAMLSSRSSAAGTSAIQLHVIRLGQALRSGAQAQAPTSFGRRFASRYSRYNRVVSRCDLAPRERRVASVSARVCSMPMRLFAILHYNFAVSGAFDSRRLHD